MMKEDGAGGAGMDAVSRAPGAAISWSSSACGEEATGNAVDDATVAAGGTGFISRTRSGENIDAEAQTARGSVTNPAMSSATGRRFAADGLAVSLKSASRAR